MDFKCSNCGQTRQYVRSLAGMYVVCPFCVTNVRNPKVDELPAELQEDLQREEEAAAREHQQAFPATTKARRKKDSRQRQMAQNQQTIRKILGGLGVASGIAAGLLSLSAIFACLGFLDNPNWASFTFVSITAAAFWILAVVACMIFLAIDVAKDIRMTRTQTMRIVQLLEATADGTEEPPPK